MTATLKKKKKQKLTPVKRKRKQTPPEVARSWGISPDKIVAWIRSGELPAIDASTQRAQRPRYLIDVDDLRDFEARRSTTPEPTPEPKPRRRQRQKSDQVIQFYR